MVMVNAFLRQLVLCQFALLPIFGMPAAHALSSVEELDEFLNGTNQTHHYYAVTGQITSVNITHIPNHLNSFILKGQARRINIFNTPITPPPPGTIVEAKGLTYHSPQNEPWMYCDGITVLGHTTPEEVLHVPFSEIQNPAFLLRKIVTEATVIDVLPDETDRSYAYLVLKDGATTFPAACPQSSRLKGLVDARVSVKGIVHQYIGSQRKHLGTCLTLSGIDAFTVLTPPPADPFDFPPLPRQLYLSPQEVARLGKRSVTGHVIAVWQGNRLYVASEDRKIIGVELSEGEPLPTYGTFVKVVGNPETDLYRINLAGARVRRENGAALPEDDTQAQSIDSLFSSRAGASVYNDEVRGCLATVKGIVRLLPSANSENLRLTLECGQYKIPVDYSANPTAADGLTIGCTVEVTGRCLIEADKWRPTRIFPRISGLALVIRKPSDIRVLSRPSWWTPQRLLLVIAGLFSALVVIIIWNRLLQRLVERRGRELYRAEIDKTKTELKIDERTRLAVELHDSISQALAGIAYQLTSSKDAVRADADTALSRIETADRMLKSCRTELRHRLHDLRSDMLEEPDFEQAVRKTISQLEGDAKIILRVNVRRSLMNDTTAQDILSVIRELVSNALHHGQAQTIKIAGCADKDAIRFSVRDDGTGFDPASAPGARQGHFGLVGIRYRLKRQNGDFSIDSSVNGGTRVSFEIPLTNDESPSEDICK